MLKKLAQAKVMLAVAFLMTLVACASSTGTSSDESYDGLTRVPDTNFQEVYRRAGADITSYSELGIAPCNVAFKKNWLRDQNSNRMDLSNRVTQKDVDRIKDSLGELCDEQFREALLEAPAYNLVDKYDEGEQVLVLKPAIINLDINAPDIKSANMSRTYTTSSGEMTLSLELVDATTGEILARAVDRRRGMDDNRLQWSSSVSNNSDAKRALKRWAKVLREGLDEARGQ